MSLLNITVLCCDEVGCDARFHGIPLHSKAEEAGWTKVWIPTGRTYLYVDECGYFKHYCPTHDKNRPPSDAEDAHAP